MVIVRLPPREAFKRLPATVNWSPIVKLPLANFDDTDIRVPLDITISHMSTGEVLKFILVGVKELRGWSLCLLQY